MPVLVQLDPETCHPWNLELSSAQVQGQFISLFKVKSRGSTFSYSDLFIQDLSRAQEREGNQDINSQHKLEHEVSWEFSNVAITQRWLLGSRS